MEHIVIAIVGFFGILFLLVLKTLVAEEVKAWTPWAIKRLILSALRRLPVEERERYKEEWLAAVADIPGNFGKLFFALDLRRASLGIARLHSRSLVPLAPKGESFGKRIIRLFVAVRYVAAREALVRVRDVSLSPRLRELIESDLQELLGREMAKASEPPEPEKPRDGQ